MKHLSDGHPKNEIIQHIAEKYGNDLWNYAFSIVGKPEIADDILQDVFIKILEKLQTFRGGSSMKTWLLSITRNTAYNSRSKWLIRKTFSIDKWSDQHSYPSAETEAIEQIEMNNAWKIVMKLPVKYREVLVLFVHHDMSQKEIAQTIGVPEGTIKSRLHYARLKFSKHYYRGVE
ncbi:RNA polymerase sigma factor [Cohnella mopanensis]|uniref:RNA polymerase sigma factor n=1 Tax=Cohnella mopanensis TaxID=2911966 RepID=UPI001EF8CA57|nr:RNA polymerase sigma factor [Cohnella mopanensis]